MSDDLNRKLSEGYAYDKKSGGMSSSHEDPDTRHGVYVDGKLKDTRWGKDAADRIADSYKRKSPDKKIEVKKIVESQLTEENAAGVDANGVSWAKLGDGKYGRTGNEVQYAPAGFVGSIKRIQPDGTITVTRVETVYDRRFGASKKTNLYDYPASKFLLVSGSGTPPVGEWNPKGAETSSANKPKVKLGDGSVVSVGDTVWFKSDFEQCGRLDKISGSTLRLYGGDEGFQGDYIDGDEYTSVSARDCWSEGQSRTTESKILGESMDNELSRLLKLAGVKTKLTESAAPQKTYADFGNTREYLKYMRGVHGTDAPQVRNARSGADDEFDDMEDYVNTGRINAEEGAVDEARYYDPADPDNEIEGNEYHPDAPQGWQAEPEIKIPAQTSPEISAIGNHTRDSLNKISSAFANADDGAELWEMMEDDEEPAEGDFISHVKELFPEDVQKMWEFGELEDNSPLYDFLFNHYNNNGEMPYNIAKARDGDPHTWVSDKFFDELEDSGTMEESFAEDFDIEIQELPDDDEQIQQTQPGQDDCMYVDIPDQDQGINTMNPEMQRMKQLAGIQEAPKSNVNRITAPLGDDEVEVEYDLQPHEPATYDYPGADEKVDVYSVKLNGQEIVDRLDPAALANLEQYVVDNMNREPEGREYNSDDRYEVDEADEEDDAEEAPRTSGGIVDVGDEDGFDSDSDAAGEVQQQSSFLNTSIDPSQLIDTIDQLQQSGMSGSNAFYDVDQLIDMPLDRLMRVYKKVTGGQVEEEDENWGGDAGYQAGDYGQRPSSGEYRSKKIFPNGATGNPTRKAGPTAAQNGDNAMYTGMKEDYSYTTNIDQIRETLEEAFKNFKK
jgi:hypothetical protein